MVERKDYAWCLDCGGRYTHAEVDGHSSCPGCGSAGVPCDPNRDVAVEVNWHELRVLGIWAENWARQISGQPGGRDHLRTVHAICRRLQGQHPKQTPLTLSEEIVELPVKLEGLGIVATGMTSNVGKPPLFPVNGPGAVGHVKPRKT